MQATTIKKYSTKTVAQLIKRATTVFNLFIRNRDKNKGCISCGKPVNQAGHFYEASAHTRMRFMEDNTQGQCIRCNHYLSGNLNEYRKNLIKRIGIERLEKLDMLAGIKTGFKWDRFTLIETIEKYKALNKLTKQQ